MNGNKIRATAFRLIGVSALALAASMPGIAQEQDEDTARLGTITVTAERRAESIQSVPIAVTALDAAALDARQIAEVQSLKSIVPNIVIEDAPGSGTSVKLFLRGVGTDNPVFSGDGAVGVYIDDVFIARALGANFDLYDVDRVEVLRGPQGTLYGRNSSGGALKIQTADPVMNETLVKAEVAAGNIGQIEAKAAFNLPVVEDKLAARVSLFSSSHDPIQENILDGSGAFDKSTQGGRAKLLWTASPDVRVVLAADFVRERSLPGEGVSFRDEDLNFDGIVDYSYDGSLYTYYSGLSNPYQSVDNSGLTAHVDWDLSGGMKFTSISAYRELDFGVRADSDGTVAARFEPNQRLENQTFSQEFNLSGGGDRFNWLGGLYYFQEQNDFLWDLTVFGNLGSPQNFQLFDQSTEAWAVFGQATFDVTDKLSVTGGLRYTEETKDFHADGFDKTGPAVAEGGTPTGTPAFTFDDSKDFGNTSYRASADYAFTENILGYVSYSTGYRSGGFNGGARTLAQVAAPPFDDETVDTAEIGMKSDWANGRLRFNATYFSSDFKNLQEASLQGGGFATLNSDAEISGFEIEASALLTDDFRVGFQGGTLDSEIKQNGNRAKYTPEFAYSVTADYNRSLANGGEFFASASAAHEDTYFPGIDNDPVREVPAHTIVDARIGYKLPGGQWEVELAGKNLFEEEYPTHSFNINLPPPPAGPGRLTTIMYPNRPRMVVLRVRVKM
ncbi:TonB-dependent receptor [Hyphomonas johnsonii]|uniref:TonB-dependent receptor n=1 Tax=Hyphomonas johnsonii MHS-2 TaxID=1280950 RepID=A0A059FS31_9PROT|nr:TonB-dependent receptor [Hyphomonas johnsonii]KCZ93470.1 TonB-dependent receptor [Hyphomonas johnsonii MHS-2]